MRHISFYAESPHEAILMELLLVAVGSEAGHLGVLLMYLYLRLGVVDKEVEILVPYVELTVVVDGAREGDGDVRKLVLFHTGKADVEVFVVAFEFLYAIDAEYRSARGIIFRCFLYGETWIGRGPADVESVNVNALDFHSRYEWQCTTDGTYLHGYLQCLRVVVLTILFLVSDDKVVHVVVAQLWIHILKEYCTID